MPLPWEKDEQPWQFTTLIRIRIPSSEPDPGNILKTDLGSTNRGLHDQIRGANSQYLDQELHINLYLKKETVGAQNDINAAGQLVGLLFLIPSKYRYIKKQH